MMKAMKKMLLMATIVVMVVSLAAPAMADEAQEPTNDPGLFEKAEEPTNEPGLLEKAEEPTNEPGLVEKAEEPYKDPGIGLCDITPTECEDTDDSSDDHGHDSGAHPDANDPNPVEEEEESKEEAASAPGGMMVGEVAGGITKSAPENDATSAPKIISAPDEAGQTAESPTVYGCHNADDEYDEELDVCMPGDETLDFFPVVSGQEPWPDTAGEYVNFLGGSNSDLPIMLGVAIQVEGHLIEDFLNWYGEDGGPIGLALQGVGYTIGLGSDVIGGLLGGAGQAVDTLHDGLGAVVDTVADAAGDAWDAISSWW